MNTKNGKSTSPVTPIVNEAEVISHLDIGTEYRSERRTLGNTEISLYAGLSGDYHPAHVDDVYAKASKFGRRVAHGMLTLSISQGLLARLPLRANIEALLAIENARFVAPVFPGDTLQCIFRITELRRSRSKPELSFMRLHGITSKSEGEKDVLVYDSFYLLTSAASKELHVRKR